MTYSSDSGGPEDGLREPLEKVVKGLGLDLLELTVFRSGRTNSVQVRLTVYKGLEPVGINDCSRAHKAVLPRLELAFGRAGAGNHGGGEDRGAKPGKEKHRQDKAPAAPDLYVEVSSPGINRLIKEGREFAYFTGQHIKCYRTDISDWAGGILVSSDEEKIVIETETGELSLAYGIIGKARLSHL